MTLISDMVADGTRVVILFILHMKIGSIIVSNDIVKWYLNLMIIQITMYLNVIHIMFMHTANYDFFGGGRCHTRVLGGIKYRHVCDMTYIQCWC